MAFQLSASSLFLNIIINFPSIMLTTFVHGVFLLYIISTKSYFKKTGESEPIETNFHKVMFVLLIIAFLGLLLIFYQGQQQSVISCPGGYTYTGDEKFATSENALITDWEAYYNRDANTFIEMAHFSDNLKRKLQLAEIEYSEHLEIQLI